MPFCGLLGEYPIDLHVSLLGVDVLGSHPWCSSINLVHVWEDPPQALQVTGVLLVDHHIPGPLPPVKTLDLDWTFKDFL